MLTESDLVWNRAALEGGGADPREGDRALAALLCAHGLIMNGGVDHAIGVLTPEELAEAVAGYRYFSFDDVADLLTAPSTGPSEDEAEELNNQRYWSSIPDDATVSERFLAVFALRRHVFAPL